MTSHNNSFAEKLADHRKNPYLGGLRSHAPKLVQDLLSCFFPHFSEKPLLTSDEIEAALVLIEKDLHEVLGALQPPVDSNTSRKFMDGLSLVYDLLLLDAEAILKGDPAAKGVDEVILCYPGFFAVAAYRFAHLLHTLNVPLFPRVITEYAHTQTGIDIHPGAKIGESFCIDHGTGIVIGETAEIHNNVRIYQGVTLGGLVVNRDLANKKRHPTIEDNVILYANATILGGNTIIGKGAIIGGSVWLTESVKPGSKVYHKGDVEVKLSE